MTVPDVNNQPDPAPSAGETEGPPEGAVLKDGDNTVDKTVPFERLKAKTLFANEQEAKATALEVELANMKAKYEPQGQQTPENVMDDGTEAPPFDVASLTKMITEQVTASVKNEMNQSMEGVQEVLYSQAQQQEIAKLKATYGDKFDEKLDMDPVTKIMKTHNLSADAAFRLTKSYQGDPEVAKQQALSQTNMDLSNGQTNMQVPLANQALPPEVQFVADAADAAIKEDRARFGHKYEDEHKVDRNHMLGLYQQAEGGR